MSDYILTVPVTVTPDLWIAHQRSELVKYKGKHYFIQGIQKDALTIIELDPWIEEWMKKRAEKRNEEVPSQKLITKKKTFFCEGCGNRRPLEWMVYGHTLLGEERFYCALCVKRLHVIPYQDKKLPDQRKREKRVTPPAR